MISYRQADFGDYMEDEFDKKRKEMEAISPNPPVLSFNYEDGMLKLIQAPGTAWNLDVAQVKEEMVKHHDTVEGSSGSWVRIPPEDVAKSIKRIAERLSTKLPVKDLTTYFKKTTTKDVTSFHIMFNI